MGCSQDIQSPRARSQGYDAFSTGDVEATSRCGPAGSMERSFSLDPASIQGWPCCHSFYLYMPHASSVCFCSGKSNPYCEISMGSQSYTTRTLQDTLNPKWNFNCQFFIKDLYQDVLCLTMFDRDQFSPDGKV